MSIKKDLTLNRAWDQRDKELWQKSPRCYHLFNPCLLEVSCAGVRLYNFGMMHVLYALFFVKVEME